MSLGTLLQTIIAVIFIYLILSLLASEIQEYIASVSEFRAKRLKESIKQLLGEDRAKEIKEAVNKVVTAAEDKAKTIKAKEIKEAVDAVVTAAEDKAETINEQADTKEEITTAVNEVVQAAEDKQKEINEQVKYLLTDLLYNNYLIPSLNQSATSIWSLIKNLGNRNRRNRKSQGPSYIKPELFAQALLMTIQDKLDDEYKLKISDKVKKSDTELTLIEKLEKIQCNPTARQKLIKVANELILEEKEPDLTHFKAKLEKLFKETQERSSGVYKRNAKGLSFVLGLIIAIIANADAFYIVSTLSKENNNFSEQVINQLEETKILSEQDREETQDTLNEEQKELLRNILNEVSGLPLGWNFDLELETQNLKSLIEILDQKNNGKTCFDVANGNTQSSKNAQCFNQFIESIEKQPHLRSYIRQDKDAEEFVEELNRIENCPKPEGNIDECWQNQESNFPTTYNTYRQKLENQLLSQRINNITTRNKLDFGDQINKQGGLLQVVFGWIISAIAIAMGAPFWFDLLGKVMSVRNAKKSTKTNSTEDE